MFSVDTARDLVNSDYQQLATLELTLTEQEVGYYGSHSVYIYTVAILELEYRGLKFCLMTKKKPKFSISLLLNMV